MYLIKQKRTVPAAIVFAPVAAAAELARCDLLLHPGLRWQGLESMRLRQTRQGAMLIVERLQPLLCLDWVHADPEGSGSAGSGVVQSYNLHRVHVGFDQSLEKD